MKCLQNFNIEDLFYDYKIDSSLFTNTDDRLLSIYHKWSRLRKASRAIIILYAELGSFEKVAKKLNVSPATVYLYIKRIKNKLLC